MDEQILINTERLTIREIDAETALKVTETVNDGDSMTEFLSSLPEDAVKEAMQDVGKVLEFSRALMSLRDENDMRRFGAWNEHGELVAYLGATSWGTRTPELALTVAEEHQCKGYGKEFANGLLPWLLEFEPIDFFVCRVRSNNIASEKIVLRAGGVLQEPQSGIEELTVKTYYIYPDK